MYDRIILKSITFRLTLIHRQRKNHIEDEISIKSETHVKVLRDGEHFKMKS